MTQYEPHGPGNDRRYNGYKNWPTFQVDLHLHNNPEYHAEVMLRINPSMRPYERAQMLKAFVVSELEVWPPGPSFAGDIIAWALSEVDWMEIANAWAEEMGLS